MFSCPFHSSVCLLPDLCPLRKGPHSLSPGHTQPASTDSPGTQLNNAHQGQVASCPGKLVPVSLPAEACLSLPLPLSTPVGSRAVVKYLLVQLLLHVRLRVMLFHSLSTLLHLPPETEHLHAFSSYSLHQE